MSTADHADATLSADDFASIRQQLARSMRALDDGHPERWAASFTDDATLHSSTDGAGTPIHLAGRAAIAGYGTASAAHLPPGARRWLNLALIESTPGGARARTYVMTYTQRQGAGCVAHASAILDADLIRSDGHWRYTGLQLTARDFDHADWAAGAKAGLAGCGGYTPQVDLAHPYNPNRGAGPLDHELIQQTLAAFLFYMDDGTQPERLAALFTEDGLWHMFGVDRLYRGGSWHGTPMEPVYAGRAAITEFNRSGHATRQPWDRHWGHSPMITIDGDTAHAYFPYATVLAGVGAHIQPMTTGLFRHRLRKTNSAWLIEECAAFIERAPADLPDVTAHAAHHYIGGVA